MSSPSPSNAPFTDRVRLRMLKGEFRSQIAGARSWPGTAVCWICNPDSLFTLVQKLLVAAELMSPAATLWHKHDACPGRRSLLVPHRQLGVKDLVCCSRNHPMTSMPRVHPLTENISIVPKDVAALEGSQSICSIRSHSSHDSPDICTFQHSRKDHVMNSPAPGQPH